VKKMMKTCETYLPKKKKKASAMEVKKHKTNLVSLDDQISGVDLWTMENSTL
jgi:hypothetical protein